MAGLFSAKSPWLTHFQSHPHLRLERFQSRPMRVVQADPNGAKHKSPQKNSAQEGGGFPAKQRRSGFQGIAHLISGADAL